MIEARGLPVFSYFEMTQRVTTRLNEGSYTLVLPPVQNNLKTMVKTKVAVSSLESPVEQ